MIIYRRSIKNKTEAQKQFIDACQCVLADKDIKSVLDRVYFAQIIEDETILFSLESIEVKPKLFY